MEVVRFEQSLLFFQRSQCEKTRFPSNVAISSNSEPPPGNVDLKAHVACLQRSDDDSIRNAADSTAFYFLKTCIMSCA